MFDSIQRRPGLILVKDLVSVGEDDRQLRRRHDLERVRRGAYVPTAVNAAADRDLQYDLRIASVLGTRRSPVVLSHCSAARVWGLPIVNPWPRTVHITESPASAKRSKNGVHVHRTELPAGDVVERHGTLVTSLTRTLIDLARVAPFRDAVAAMDHALHEKLTDKPQLVLAMERQQVAAGRRRAQRAIEFATPLAKLPGESYSRVLMHELGFPAPELQHEFTTPLVGKRFADFWWEHIRLLGEFDGKAKYTDPLYAGSRTPVEVMWAEKQRENELGEHDVRLRRWVWSDLEQGHPFIARLESAGLRRVPARRFV